MSAWTICDWCDKRLPNDAPEIKNDWLSVTWASNGLTADYCTAACTVAGVEKARDDDAALLMAAMDEEDQ